MLKVWSNAKIKKNKTFFKTYYKDLKNFPTSVENFVVKFWIASRNVSKKKLHL